MSEKLQKVLARAGLGSRREIETWIADGRLTVNGEQATLGARVEASDIVKLDGIAVRVMPAEGLVRKILMYHKPEGEVTTRDDPEGRPTVFDRLPRLRGGRWIAVGRLDLNTSGLLLFTNDGELANRLMHPSSELEREYAVRIHGELKPAQRRKLQEGVQLEDGPAKFSSIVSKGGGVTNNWYHVIISEGRTREVRRMFEAVELMVSRLIRVRYGDLALDPLLKQGMLRELDKEEADALVESVGLEPSLSRGERRRAVANARASKPKVKTYAMNTDVEPSEQVEPAPKKRRSRAAVAAETAESPAAEAPVRKRRSAAAMVDAVVVDAAEAAPKKRVRKAAKVEEQGELPLAAEASEAAPKPRTRRKAAASVEAAVEAAFPESDEAPKPRRSRKAAAPASSHFADEAIAAPNVDASADEQGAARPLLTLKVPRAPRKKLEVIVPERKGKTVDPELLDGGAMSLRAPRRGAGGLSDRMGMRDDRDLRRGRGAGKRSEGNKAPRTRGDDDTRGNRVGQATRGNRSPHADNYGEQLTTHSLPEERPQRGARPARGEGRPQRGEGRPPRGEGRSFGEGRGDRPARGEGRPPRGEGRSFGEGRGPGDRPARGPGDRPARGEGRPQRGEGRSFGENRGPGDRPARGEGRPPRGEGRSFGESRGENRGPGDRPARGEGRPPRGEGRSFGENRGPGDRPARGEGRPPRGEGRSFGENRGPGDRPARGEGRPPRGEGRGFGENRGPGDRPARGDGRPPRGEGRGFGESRGENRGPGDRSARGEGRPPRGEGRSFGEGRSEGLTGRPARSGPRSGGAGRSGGTGSAGGRPRGPAKPRR